MSDHELIKNHYTHGSLLDAIRAGVHSLGKSPENVTVEDLGPVDEFHTGGRVATKSLLDQLGIEAGHRVLDVGCGLGGTSRFTAHRYGCHVSGIDLTDEYVSTGTALCSWVGLADRIDLQVGDDTSLPFEPASFDRVFMTLLKFSCKQLLISTMRDNSLGAFVNGIELRGRNFNGHLLLRQGFTYICCQPGSIVRVWMLRLSREVAMGNCAGRKGMEFSYFPRILRGR